MVGTLKVPCEARVVRYAHDALAGECLNIGVVLYCPAHRYLAARFITNWERIKGAFRHPNLDHLRQFARSLEDACAVHSAEMRNGLLPFERVADIGVVIDGLVAKEDSSIQWSPTISGVTPDPNKTLEELLARYAGKRVGPARVTTRDDEAVWRTVAAHFDDPSIVRRMQPHRVTKTHMAHEFRHAWKNGVWNVAQPVSLDFVDARYVTDKAALWTGRMSVLQPKEEGLAVTMLIGEPSEDKSPAVHKAARDAFSILQEQCGEQVSLLMEKDAATLARKIIMDLAHENHE